MKKFNLNSSHNFSCFGISIILLIGLLVSGCALSQVKEFSPAKESSLVKESSSVKRVQYDDYGKPLSSTRGEFVVAKSVNLRSRADTNSQVIGVLPAGAIVMVGGVTHGYYKITFKGKAGYSWHKFFTPK